MIGSSEIMHKVEGLKPNLSEGTQVSEPTFHFHYMKSHQGSRKPINNHETATTRKPDQRSLVNSNLMSFVSWKKFARTWSELIIFHFDNEGFSPLPASHALPWAALERRQEGIWEMLSLRVVGSIASALLCSRWRRSRIVGGCWAH